MKQRKILLKLNFRVLFTGIHEKYRYKFNKAGIIEIIKEENLYSTIDDAVATIRRSRSFSEIA